VNPSAVSTAVTDHQLSGVLEITWQDGHTSRLPHAVLRKGCRCASCQQILRSTGAAAPAAPGLRISAINLVSDKGLNLVFDDGHGRGIFPWFYLRELDAEGSAVLTARV